MERCKEKDLVIVMGGFNAKIGKDNTGCERITGRHELGEMNENGEMFADFCSDFECVIGGSVFPHKETHKVTWDSPNSITENQIDRICVSRKYRRSLLDVRVKRGADAGSDHHLLIAKVSMKLRRCYTPSNLRG